MFDLSDILHFVSFRVPYAEKLVAVAQSGFFFFKAWKTVLIYPEYFVY